MVGIQCSIMQKWKSWGNLSSSDGQEIELYRDLRVPW
jgi:hypothetical protein